MDDSGKPWRYALVQHPMWLIIAEDSLCAERTPPWGCESIEEYARRLQESLDALDRFPELRLNFDFSAVELEDLAGRFPEMMLRIRRLVKQGRLSFLNGTYSQPHLQIVSVESAIRQFEFGVRLIDDLTGCRVTCYASQEPGFSPQLPQILGAMGYRSAVTPDFPFGIETERGRTQHWDKKWEWLEGDDLVNWVGSDGTSIPLWLKSGGSLDEGAIADDAQHGLLNRTRLRADMPDMLQIDSDWVNERTKLCEFVSLEDALQDLAREHPPQPTVRIDPNYAYIEGVDAEALSRANTRAESALLSIEALHALLPVNAEAFDFEEAWKTLLACQHHDAYWIGAPELRAKSISRLHDLTQDVEAGLKRLAESLAEQIGGDQSVIILDPYPKPRRAVVHLSGGGTESVFPIESNGIGYRALTAVPASRREPCDWEEMTEPYFFANEFYSVKICPDGAISSVATRDEDGLVESAGNQWLYRAGDSDVEPMGRHRARVTQGPVLNVFETQNVKGSFDVTMHLLLYHDLPWFEVETELDFAKPTEIGGFFDDRTKLHHAWHVGRDVKITHALGGCPWQARVGKTFFANPWIRIGRDGQGLALCLFNAAKCWLDEDGWLRCVAAWGHGGDRFHNRQGPLPGIMGPLNWAKPMDLLLRGKHTVRFAVWPHGSGVGDSDVADWTASLLLPPRAYLVQAGGGEMPSSRTCLSVQTGGLLPLSVRSDGPGRAILRLMEMGGETRKLSAESEAGWRVEGLTELGGQSVATVGPHRIVEAHLALTQ